MATTSIEIQNDVTRAKEDVEGSDGRMNVSSRQDSRMYYNSRDRKQAYSFVYNFDLAENNEVAAYLQNTSSDGKEIVIEHIGVNSDSAIRIEADFVTGTAAGGTTVTPTNLNRTSSNAANASAMEGGSASTGVTGLTVAAKIDRTSVAADGHQEFELKDSVRLGQNDAIAITVIEGTTADTFGVIYFYFE